MDIGTIYIISIEKNKPITVRLDQINPTGPGEMLMFIGTVVGSQEAYMLNEKMPFYEGEILGVWI